ncbi:MAG: plasmid stabilization system protein ParE [Candidatus Binatia bacterium]|jgi:plasmid stabilization system protein ParE
MATISVHPQVEVFDMAEIFDFIAADNLDAADRVADGIVATFRELARQPFIGRPYPLKHPMLQGIRMCPAFRIPSPSFKNYLIFYRPADDEIRILYVFHVARDVPPLMAADVRE